MRDNPYINYVYKVVYDDSEPYEYNRYTIGYYRTKEQAERVVKRRTYQRSKDFTDECYSPGYEIEEIEIKG